MKVMLVTLVLVFTVSPVFAQTSTYNCSRDFDTAKSMVLADGSVKNEQTFLTATTIAVEACSDLAQQRKFKDLSVSIDSMRQNCDASALEGLSQLYHGTCYLKLADLARFILGE